MTQDAIERLREMLEYLDASAMDYLLAGGRKLHTDDLRAFLTALDGDEVSEAMVEAGKQSALGQGLDLKPITLKRIYLVMRSAALKAIR